MKELKITFRLSSSFGTSFQADTIFGHICWAIAYTEGTDALKKFLDEYDNSVPLLVSDGFPVYMDEIDSSKRVYYFPRPVLPRKQGDRVKIEEMAGIDTGNKAELKLLFSALKKIDKKNLLPEITLNNFSANLNNFAIVSDFFKLKYCPINGLPVTDLGCTCKSWRECPGLGAKENEALKCKAFTPTVYTALTMHNQLNRWTGTSDNLFVSEEHFPDCGYFFLIKIDEQIMTESRFKSLLDYVAMSGYGRDATTGKGAIIDIEYEDFLWKSKDCNAFINLSSAYAPKPGELTKGYYTPHIKRGKLGGSFVLKYSPWKKPILMLQSGGLFNGDPSKNWGSLIKNVHYEEELSDVVQYGYAYPLGVKYEE